MSEQTSLRQGVAIPTNSGRIRRLDQKASIASDLWDQLHTVGHGGGDDCEISLRGEHCTACMWVDQYDAMTSRHLNHAVECLAGLSPYAACAHLDGCKA